MKKSFILTDFVNGKNNNKFWNIIVDGGVVTTEYGRVGEKAQSTVKNMGSDVTANNFAKKKIAEKLDKGYSEIEVISDSIITTSPQTTIIREQISSDPMVAKFVDKIVAANVHKILQSTSLQVNAQGLFTTPLGIVTPKQIEEARNVLVEASSHDANIPILTSKYLRLIPHSTGMKPDLSILATTEKIRAENDILDSLLQSYNTVMDRMKNDNPKTVEEKMFNIDFRLINSSQEAERINKYFEQSKSQHHYGRSGAKVINVFSLNLYDKPKINPLNNSVEVFHGTGIGNLLSIMKNGLMVTPPANAIIAGKMFGHGVYGAINSTKSMGYTQNYGGESGWMFICQFEMGKYYHPTRTVNYPPQGYDSVWARKNDCGLLHDELIVYQNERVQITHLLEFK